LASAPALGQQMVAVPANPTATVLHWRLAGNVNDMSGNGISAYLAGSVSWKTAPAGARKFLSATPSLYFDNGAYPQVYHPSTVVPHIAGDVSFTMMVWVYYDSRNWPSDWVGVFGTTPTPDKGAFNNGLGLAVYQGNPCLTWYGDELRALNSINTQTWYHIAVTRTAGSPLKGGASIYVNGDKWESWALGVGSKVVASVLDGTPVLGRAGDIKTKTSPSRYFHGYLKDARIYPSALPADAVKKIFNEEW